MPKLSRSLRGTAQIVENIDPSLGRSRRYMGKPIVGICKGAPDGGFMLLPSKIMIDLAEEIVSIWLELQEFFLIRNVRYGRNKEIDILAINGKEKRHIEVQVSSNPLAILSDKVDISDADFIGGAQKYYEKKFNNPETLKITNKLLGRRYQRYLVLGNFKSRENIDELRKLGVMIIPFEQVIADIKSDSFSDIRIVSADRYRQVLGFLAKE